MDYHTSCRGCLRHTRTPCSPWCIANCRPPTPPPTASPRLSLSTLTARYRVKDGSPRLKWMTSCVLKKLLNPIRNSCPGRAGQTGTEPSGGEMKAGGSSGEVVMDGREAQGCADGCWVACSPEGNVCSLLTTSIHLSFEQSQLRHLASCLRHPSHNQHTALCFYTLPYLCAIPARSSDGPLCDLWTP